MKKGVLPFYFSHRFVTLVFGGVKPPLESFDDFRFYYEYAASKVLVVPAGLTFLVFLIWDVRINPDHTIWLSLSRISYLVVSIFLLLAFVLIREKMLVRVSILLFAALASVLSELISLKLGDGAKQGPSGQLLIMFFASGLFLTPLISTLVIVSVSIFSRITLLVFVGAEGVFVFSELYYLAVGASLSILISITLSLFMVSAFERSVMLRRERELNKRILSQILPEHVLGKLEGGRRSYAEGRSEVSIVFSDIVGFSSLAKSVSPGHLLDILTDIFSKFDEIADSHGLQKIKTIGDSYMAVAGLKGEGADEVMRAISFSLEATEWIKAYSEEKMIDINLRTGIATGSAIAGVIGGAHPQFDVWGDTVNLASRLETSCPVNSIQISEATYWRVRGALCFDALAEIEIKDHGLVKTYIVTDQIRFDL